jgi:hypothetical protein
MYFKLTRSDPPAKDYTDEDFDQKMSRPGCHRGRTLGNIQYGWPFFLVVIPTNTFADTGKTCTGLHNWPDYTLY